MIVPKIHEDLTKDQVRVDVASATPFKRECKVEDLDDLVVYLVYEKSSFLTGNTVDIKGALAYS